MFYGGRRFMASSEDIPSVPYQNQATHCQKLVNEMNGRDLESSSSSSSSSSSDGALQHARVDIMGDDGFLLLPQNSMISCFEKPPGFDLVPNCEQVQRAAAAAAKGEDKGGSDVVRMEFRNRVARQWRCPALALKALELMPVRNIFRVTQSAVEPKPPELVEADAGLVKSRDAFLNEVDNGAVSEKKMVSITLAFQRWRQSQLKSVLGQELTKVLEEAREDEIARASLEAQLSHTEQLLSTERAKSAMLHSQLDTAVNSTKFYESGYNTSDNATVSKIDKQAITVADFTAAETAIEMRDNQIQQFRERIRSLEDKIGRVDRQLNRLHVERSDLQAENSIVLRENRSLLEQLSSRDKEVITQEEELERVKALATRLKEQQNSKQDRFDAVVAEHSAEVKILQEQLQQAYRANSRKEAELATSVEHCSHLKHEKGTLLMQLQEAEKRAELASTRAEKLCAKLQCRIDGADESASAASEMVKHLSKLTQNARELEPAINGTELAQPPSSSHVDQGSSVRNRILENNTFPQDSDIWGNFPMHPMGNGQDRSNLSFSSASEHNVQDSNGMANSVAWKWRWAASRVRAEILARKLRNFNQKVFEDLHQDHKQQKVQQLLQRLGIGNLTTRRDLDDSKSNMMLVDPKLVPLVLSAWREFTRTSVQQRKALYRSSSLDKLLEALPWWMRRVRDRRQLQRSFFQWLIFALSAKRQPSDSQPNLANTPRSLEPPASCEDHSRTVPYKPPSTFSTKLRQVKGPSDEMNAVNSQIRRAQRTSVAGYATPKHRLPGDNNRNHLQLPSGAQTRALQALQTTLQQEVSELKKIACQEIQPLQRNSQMRSRPVTAPTESSYAKQRQPDGKKVLKSVLGVCNNLAMALTNVRGKLSPHVRADTATNYVCADATNKPRAKISPRLLADTVNTCLRNEQQTKITRGPTARPSIPEGQSPREPGCSNQIGQSYNNSCSRKQPVTTSNPQQALEKRTRIVTSAAVTPRETEVHQEPPVTSRYQSPFRSQTAAPNPGKKSGSQTPAGTDQTQNSTPYKDNKCNTTAQEIRRFKRPSSVPRDKSRPSKPTQNPVLSMSVINRVLGDAATHASMEEKKLVGSALARLVSTKISKLRAGQAT